MFECQDCNFTSELENDLTEHVKEKHFFSCQECNYSSISEYNVNEHSMKHHKTNQFKTERCPGCNNEVVMKHNLELKCVMYKCNNCSFELTIPDNAKENVVNNDRDLPENVYICGECQKSFSSRQTFDKHNHEVTEDKNLTCEECGKTFNKITDVYDHAFRTHKQGPLNKDGMVSQGNLFLNVLAYQVDCLLTNFQTALSELKEIKSELKTSKCKSGINETTDINQSRKNTFETLMETMNRKIDKLGKEEREQKNEEKIKSESKKDKEHKEEKEQLTKEIKNNTAKSKDTTLKSNEGKKAHERTTNQDTKVESKKNDKINSSNQRSGV